MPYSIGDVHLRGDSVTIGDKFGLNSQFTITAYLGVDKRGNRRFEVKCSVCSTRQVMFAEAMTDLAQCQNRACGYVDNTLEEWKRERSAEIAKEQAAKDAIRIKAEQEHQEQVAAAYRQGRMDVLAQQAKDKEAAAAAEAERNRPEVLEARRIEQEAKAAERRAIVDNLHPDAVKRIEKYCGKSVEQLTTTAILHAYRQVYRKELEVLEPMRIKLL